MTKPDALGGAGPAWDTVTLGGHRFWKFPLKEGINASGDEEGFILMPHHERLSKKEFPGDAPLEGAGPYISSGISIHTVGYDDGPSRYDREPPDQEQMRESVRAIRRFAIDAPPQQHVDPRRLVIFNEIDWYGECLAVLKANDWWTGHSEPTSSFLSRIETIIDLDERLSDFFSDLPDDESRRMHQLALGAERLARPLSRLWYCASMMALFYVDYDDMRLGYLWSEYQTKVRFEPYALKHIAMTETNRENGKKGGKAGLRAQRYRILDQLAKERFNDFAFADDRQRLRIAKEMAAKHDRSSPEPLFQERGKGLSSGWYRDWATHFLSFARGNRSSKSAA